MLCTITCEEFKHSSAKPFFLASSVMLLLLLLSSVHELIKRMRLNFVKSRISKKSSASALWRVDTISITFLKFNLWCKYYVRYIYLSECTFKNTGILNTHLLPHKTIFYDEATNATQNNFKFLFSLHNNIVSLVLYLGAIYEDVRDIFMAW